MRATKLSTRQSMAAPHRSVAAPCRSISINIDINTSAIRSQVAKKLVNIANKIAPVIKKPVTEQPKTIVINSDDLWQTRGLKAPIHLEERYNYHDPLSKHEVWRYRELEKQDIIKKLDKNPKDEELKAYTRLMYPKKEDYEFLFDSTNLIKSVVSKDNTIVIPPYISDVYEFAEIVKAMMKTRNIITNRSFSRLPFFETYHFHSRRFPMADNRIEIDSSLGSKIDSEIKPLHPGGEVKTCTFSVVKLLNHNKIFLRERTPYDYNFLSLHMWNHYISTDDLKDEMYNKWLKERQTLPIWHNHVLVTDE